MVVAKLITSNIEPDPDLVQKFYYVRI